MKKLLLSIAALLFVTAISQAQAEVTQPQPFTSEVIQGHYLGSIRVGDWVLLTGIPLDSCAYQIAIGTANDLWAAVLVGSDFAYQSIAKMYKPQITVKTKQEYAGYGPDIVSQIISKANIKLDSITIMLAHPLAYQVLFTDSEGKLTLHLALGWEKKYCPSLEEAVLRSVKQAADEVLAEKSRALLEEADEL